MSKRKLYSSKRAFSSFDAEIEDSQCDSGFDKTVRALSVALKYVTSEKSSNLSVCKFCERRGHSADSCFLSPANPNKKISPKILEAMGAEKNVYLISSKIHQYSQQRILEDRKLRLAASIVEKTTVRLAEDLRTHADSGATIHSFQSKEVVEPGTITRCDQRTILSADSTSVTATQSGEVILPFKEIYNTSKSFLLTPNPGYTLVYTGRLADNGIESYFRRFDVLLKIETTGAEICCGNRDETSGVYTLLFSDPQNSVYAIGTASQISEPVLWHRLLAHMNERHLKLLHNHVSGVPVLTAELGHCWACELRKA